MTAFLFIHMDRVTGDMFPNSFEIRREKSNIRQMRRTFIAFSDRISKLTPRQVTTLNLFLVGLLGTLDYLSGFEISFSFFYLLPISIAAWYVDTRSGRLITFLSVSTWLVSNWLAGESYSSEWIRFFNASVRLTVFFLIAQLLSELKHALHDEQVLAGTDDLTGLFNRREFNKQLSFELQRAAHLVYPVSLAYIDLDNFKKVNDEQGHDIGDEYLQLVAQIISAVIRRTDPFARLGGDEFALLLPNVNQQQSRLIIGKIEEAVGKKMATLHSPITLSIGVITFQTLPATAEDMIRKADALMYQAKERGKDQVCYFEV